MPCPCRFYFVRPEDGGISVVLCACFAREHRQFEPNAEGPRSAIHEAWVASVKKSVVPEGVECFDITEKELPNRVFRNAWRHHVRDKIQVDPAKATEIHLHRIRKARERQLAKLDADWMKASGRGKKAEADAVEAKREFLRNLPQTLIEAAKNMANVDELHAFWPEDLGERDMSVP